MEKIKILHITHAHGGIKTFIENIVNYSDDEKYEHYIVGTDVIKNYGNKFKKKQDIFINRQPHLLHDIISLIKIIFFIRVNDPQIIHCHSGKGGLLGKLAAFLTRRKCVYTPHAFPYLGFRGFRRLFIILLEKMTRRFPDILLAVSASEARRAEIEIGYPRNKIVTIQNSIDTTKRDYIRNNIFPQKVGMIGRLIYQKNPLMFFKVALQVHKYCPDARFELLGAGYQDFLSKEVEYFIKQNKMEQYCSIITWDTNPNKVSEFYYSLSIFVMTSNFEGLPYSLLEAMERGIPCIVTDCDGNRDVIIDGYNGFIVPIDDANLMAQNICNLLSDEALYNRISFNGYRTVLENHNIRKNIYKYENVYLNLYK